ncbi:hypothetical protein BT96DRAFT_1000612 [Gymnopus androsaceus JB14]|uniref:Carboxylic ester hydrolase n=1 Tax=Gymnopus androsaceus JB14 TaxID=1447944 RepID=A0A6A4H510_9AGAR|nr:hypothetical protein BT96DRAFT_1000612 [Gymnopus androsaceus JB14]
MPLFYFPIAAFTPLCLTDVTFNVLSPDDPLYRSTYAKLSPASCFEYAWNLGIGPHMNFSFLGAHYDCREEYINHFPHDSPFHQDLAIQFVYKEVEECLLGDEVIPLPVTLYAYCDNSDFSFTELYGAVHGFGVPYQYKAPNLRLCLGRDLFLALVKWFKGGLDHSCIGPDGTPLFAKDHIVECHLGQKLMRLTSRNMVEEEALVLWLSSSTCNRLWSMDFADFCSSFILSSYATEHIWSVNIYWGLGGLYLHILDSSN